MVIKYSDEKKNTKTNQEQKQRQNNQKQRQTKTNTNFAAPGAWRTTQTKAKVCTKTSKKHQKNK